jgi:hypothetical protein
MIGQMRNVTCLWNASARSHRNGQLWVRGVPSASTSAKPVLSDSLRDEWQDPYYFCIYGMLSLIRLKVLRDPTTLPIPLFFLFDNKPKFEGAALKLYREYQQEHDPQEEIFDRIAFGSRKKHKPLQTADLLVGVINHRFEEMTRGVGPELSKMKKPMDVLFKKEIAITFPTAELLKEFADFAQRHPLKV